MSSPHHSATWSPNHPARLVWIRPPDRPLASKICGDSPASCNVRAETRPLMPAPTIAIRAGPTSAEPARLSPSVAATGAAATAAMKSRLRNWLRGAASGVLCTARFRSDENSDVRGISLPSASAGKVRLRIARGVVYKIGYRPRCYDYGWHSHRIGSRNLCSRKAGGCSEHWAIRRSRPNRASTG